MKKTILITIITLLTGLLIGWVLFHNRVSNPSSSGSGRIGIEEVLRIRELHLVEHRYEDIFFLHRRNDPDKSIRAVARVPVTIRAFIDLKKAGVTYSELSAKKYIEEIAASIGIDSYHVTIDKELIRQESKTYDDRDLSIEDNKAEEAVEMIGVEGI